MNLENYFTVNEAANRVRVRPQTLRNMMAARKIRYVKFGGRSLVPESALSEMITEPLPVRNYHENF